MPLGGSLQMYGQVLALVSLGSLCLWSLFIFSDHSSSLTYNRLILNGDGGAEAPHGPPAALKEKVLLYAATTYFGKDMPKMDKRFLKMCPKDVQEYCTLSSNKKDIPKADAIIYHNRDFTDVNYVKDSSKLHVMFTSESQQHESIRFKPDMINWTITFKKDSEIFCPYGQFDILLEEKNVDLESIWNMKEDNLTAAWMASNCQASNHRTELIKNAKKKGLQLDIYGGCGKSLPNCGRYDNDHYACAISTLGKYKFYFAFENSNCVDYLTEKFWYALRMYNAVPIVIQRKLFTDLGIPGNVFVALDDFSSMQEMVDFLNKLKDDKKRYLSYHEWRKYYKVYMDDNDGFCDLCNRLRQGNMQPHVYHDLVEWFSPKNQCNNSYADKYLH